MPTYKWRAGEVVTCPLCGVRVRLIGVKDAHGRELKPISLRAATDKQEKGLAVDFSGCPSCAGVLMASVEALLWPRARARKAAAEVPADIGADFNEAADVFPISAKASAALARRCLQHLLRVAGGAKSGNLSREIDHVLPSLPPWLSGDVDAIRIVGNFAAHPEKDQATGQIVDVEPGEAEWLLNTLESLFDYYYVEPAKAKAKRDALNQKLAQAGKQPMKA